MRFSETHRDLPLLAWPREILSTVIALEQAFLVFRPRHARMVGRVNGRRKGTAETKEPGRGDRAPWCRLGY